MSNGARIHDGGTPRAPHPVCGIIPPHLLRQIARAGEGTQASAAARTLEAGLRVGGNREVRAARSRRTGPPGAGAGLVPPHLRQRLEGVPGVAG
ncbi:MAG: hypothetical protein L0H74_15395, partial [Brachybacterium sp.]|nr:hypothetical protein [Brachybacterium sp.]